MGILAASTKIGYGIETVAGTKPSSYTQLVGVTSIPSLTDAPTTVDVTPVDTAKSGNTVYAMGLNDTGGAKDVEFNMSKTILSAWDTMYAAYTTGLTTGMAMWFEITYPSETDFTEEFTAIPSKLRISGADGVNNVLKAVASLVITNQITQTIAT